MTIHFEMLPPFEFWTVYERPNPLQYVARLSPVQEGAEHLLVSSYLETVRATLQQRGLQRRLPRDPADDPMIVEVWL